MYNPTLNDVLEQLLGRFEEAIKQGGWFPERLKALQESMQQELNPLEQKENELRIVDVQQAMILDACERYLENLDQSEQEWKKLCSYLFVKAIDSLLNSRRAELSAQERLLRAGVYLKVTDELIENELTHYRRYLIDNLRKPLRPDNEKHACQIKQSIQINERDELLNKMDALLEEKTEIRSNFMDEVKALEIITKEELDALCRRLEEQELTPLQLKVLEYIDHNDEQGLGQFLEARCLQNDGKGYGKLSQVDKKEQRLKELHHILPFTCLARACYEGRTERVHRLLKLDYPVNSPDEQGYYPIHRAAQTPQIEEQVKLLTLLSKDRYGQPRPGFNSNQPAQVWAYSRIPLHTAALYGCFDAASWLIDHGADINKQEGGLRQKNTALHNAVYNGHVAIVKLLLGNGADHSLKNYGRFTPLAEAFRALNPYLSPEEREAVIYVFTSRGIQLTNEDITELKTEPNYKAFIRPLLQEHLLQAPGQAGIFGSSSDEEDEKVNDNIIPHDNITEFH